MKKVILIICICVAAYILIFILYISIQKLQRGIDDDYSNEINNDTIIYRPTLLLENKYYQFTRLETIVEPENISYLGVINSASENNTLPVDLF
jgi:hypothetical protein